MAQVTSRRRARAALNLLSRLAEAGTAPSAYALLPDHTALVEELVAAFGSLGAARDNAGLARGRPTETPETVIASLRDLSELGVRLVPRELRRLGEDQLLRGCYELFGSLPAARAAAGLAAPAREERAVAPKDAVLAALVRLAGPVGTLRGRDVRGALALDARHHFGATTAAIDAAGVGRLKANQRWTKDTLLAALADRRARGQEVTWTALKRDGRNDLASAIRRHLGGMSAVQSTKPRRAVTTAKPLRRALSSSYRTDAATTQRHAHRLRTEIGALTAKFVAQLVMVAVVAAKGRVQHALAARVPTRPIVRPRATPPLRPAGTRAVAHSATPLALDPVRLHAVLSEATARHRLSPREAQVLAAMVHGIPRGRLAERFGTGENTVRTQVKSLLGKIGKDTLSDAVWWIRTQVEGSALINAAKRTRIGRRKTATG